MSVEMRFDLRLNGLEADQSFFSVSTVEAVLPSTSWILRRAVCAVLDVADPNVSNKQIRVGLRDIRAGSEIYELAVQLWEWAGPKVAEAALRTATSEVVKLIFRYLRGDPLNLQESVDRLNKTIERVEIKLDAILRELEAIEGSFLTLCKEIGTRCNSFSIGAIGDRSFFGARREELIFVDPPIYEDLKSEIFVGPVGLRVSVTNLSNKTWVGALDVHEVLALPSTETGGQGVSDKAVKGWKRFEIAEDATDLARQLLYDNGAQNARVQRERDRHQVEIGGSLRVKRSGAVRRVVVDRAGY